MTSLASGTILGSWRKGEESCWDFGSELWKQCQGPLTFGFLVTWENNAIHNCVRFFLKEFKRQSVHSTHCKIHVTQSLTVSWCGFVPTKCQRKVFSSCVITATWLTTNVSCNWFIRCTQFLKCQHGKIIYLGISEIRRLMANIHRAVLINISKGVNTLSVTWNYPKCSVVSSKAASFNKDKRQ